MPTVLIIVALLLVASAISGGGALVGTESSLPDPPDLARLRVCCLPWNPTPLRQNQEAGNAPS
jgi:hypothetical protein